MNQARDIKSQIRKSVEQCMNRSKGLQLIPLTLFKSFKATLAGDCLTLGSMEEGQEEWFQAKEVVVVAGGRGKGKSSLIKLLNNEKEGQYQKDRQSLFFEVHKGDRCFIELHQIEDQRLFSSNLALISRFASKLYFLVGVITRPQFLIIQALIAQLPHLPIYIIHNFMFVKSAQKLFEQQVENTFKAKNLRSHPHRLNNPVRHISIPKTDKLSMHDVEQSLSKSLLSQLQESFRYKVSMRKLAERLGQVREAVKEGYKSWQIKLELRGIQEIQDWIPVKQFFSQDYTHVYFFIRDCQIQSLQAVKLTPSQLLLQALAHARTLKWTRTLNREGLFLEGQCGQIRQAKSKNGVFMLEWPLIHQ